MWSHFRRFNNARYSFAISQAYLQCSSVSDGRFTDMRRGNPSASVAQNSAAARQRTGCTNRDSATILACPVMCQIASDSEFGEACHRGMARNSWPMAVINERADG
jgi:hypothetical protein